MILWHDVKVLLTNLHTAIWDHFFFGVNFLSMSLCTLVNHNSLFKATLHFAYIIITLCDAWISIVANSADSRWLMLVHCPRFKKKRLAFRLITLSENPSWSLITLILQTLRAKWAMFSYFKIEFEFSRQKSTCTKYEKWIFYQNNFAIFCSFLSPNKWNQFYIS